MDAFEIFSLAINILGVPLTLAMLWERSRRKASFRWERRSGILFTPAKYYLWQLFYTIPYASGPLTVQLLRHPSPLWSMGIILALLMRLALLTFNLALEQADHATTGPWRVR